MDAPVSTNFTLEAVVQFDNLPLNFNNLADRKVFVGATDDTGPTAGLFFSKAGIAYAGAVNSPLQVMPGSAGLVQEGSTYVIRIAVSSTTGVVFVYVTELSVAQTSGLQLLYVLPVVAYTAIPPGIVEGTHIHVAGTGAEPSKIQLLELCLSSSTLVPILQPIADAGPDQAVRACNIIQLDGTASFDPQGFPLTYQWRLIDAPVGSMFVFDGQDGTTQPEAIPTGFTNKFFSTSFTGVNPFPIAAGDVLLVGGVPYTVIAGPIGPVPGGYYVQISDFLLPDNLTNVAFKIIKQSGLKDPTTAKPSFFPDIVGFYKFDLVVFNGQLFSKPSVAVTNVLASLLPRGCIPDLRFLWNYLSDFWDLVEDRERIETVWSGLAQIAATELYTLWQTEYSKSIRDIQRTFVRRWLHYDLLLREPFMELAQIRTVWRGIDSGTFLTTNSGLTGTTVSISVPFATSIFTYTFTGNAPLTAAAAAKELLAALKLFDDRFNVTAVYDSPTTSILRIYAAFPFTIVAGTTAPFLIGATNVTLFGGGGVITTTRTYKVPISLAGIDIKEDDILQVQFAGEYRHVRVASVTTGKDPGELPLQRLNLKDDLPIAGGSGWSFPVKIVSTQLDFYNGLASDSDACAFEIVDNEQNNIAYMAVFVLDAIEPAHNVLVVLPDSDVLLYLSSPKRFNVYFWGVYRRRYMPIEEVVTDIPFLQRIIKNPEELDVLHRNTDFYLETFRGKKCIRFNTPAVWGGGEGLVMVPRLWAEYTSLDNRPTIEGNFGLAVDFTLDNLEALGQNVDYLSAVQGLWYAYLNGPTLFNLRAGTQILLGLPFAEEDSVIVEIRTDFSPTRGRLLLRDSNNAEIVRSYYFPKVLPLEVNPATGLVYVEGDSVRQFAPLVTGAEIVDWVKDPDWVQKMVSQGIMYEVEKFHRFMVRVNSAAFTLPTLLFVRNFILNIKPTYTYPIFVVSSEIGDTEIEVTDDTHYFGHLQLFMGAYMKDVYESATMFDQPNPSPGWMPVPGGPPAAPLGLLSGHWVNAFDTGNYQVTGLPVYPAPPTADVDITWAYDMGNLRPEMFIVSYTSVTFLVITSMIFDSIFQFDNFAWGAQKPLVHGTQYMRAVPATGRVILEVLTAAAIYPVNGVQLYIKGRPTPGHVSFRVQILVNNVVQFDEPFTHTGDGQFVNWGPAPAPVPVPTPFVVNPGDVVVTQIVPDVVGYLKPFMHAVTVSMGAAVGWAFDMGLPFGPPPLPAGTYSKVDTLLCRTRSRRS